MEMMIMTITKKDVKKLSKEIESLGVEIIEIINAKHLKLKVKNPQTGTVKLITVSKSPRAYGRWNEIKSSVRKVFRKEGETL
tara:strand:+ start:130 stop:375 length:246 start_codon:yes stop_codon:yes gene_type:complete